MGILIILTNSKSWCPGAAFDQIGNGVSEGSKPVYWLDAGIHAREWIAPATALYLIHTLVTNYGTDEEVTRMLDTYDFYILPVFNPDGYDYTWTRNRLWRKNRAPTKARPFRLPWHTAEECTGKKEGLIAAIEP